MQTKTIDLMKQIPEIPIGALSDSDDEMKTEVTSMRDGIDQG
jgi:hypothetical protein